MWPGDAVPQSELITPFQCRSGLEMAEWSVEDLAERSGVEAETIELFAGKSRVISDEIRACLRRNFEFAGVVFLNAELQMTAYDPRVLRTRGVLKWKANNKVAAN